MNLDRFLLPGRNSRLLPAEKLHVPTVALLAIMTFAMVVVAATGLALANAASMVAAGSENRIVVQIPAAATDKLGSAVAAAKAVPGVMGVEAVPEQEMRDTLERWLGGAAASTDLPVPALATVELAPGADRDRLRAAIRAAVPEATLTGEQTELEPLLSSLRSLQWLALALVAMMAAAIAAAIVLAARGALDTHRATVEIMHRIGATDSQITRLFERKIAVDALAGALAGTAAAAIVLLVVGGGLAAASTGLALRSPLGALEFALIALVPILAVVLVTGVARLTLLRALRRSL